MVEKEAVVEGEAKLTEHTEVESVTTDGGSLVVTLASTDRDELTTKGRQMVIEYLGKTPSYNSWATAGVEPASGPMAFDPDNPDADPYELLAKDAKGHDKWSYRQMFKLTKMI